VSVGTFVNKIQLYHRMVTQKQIDPRAKFIFSVDPARLQTDCKHLELDRVDADTYWDGLMPYCTAEENVDHYIKHSESIISCEGCPLYEKGDNNYYTAVGKITRRRGRRNKKNEPVRAYA